MLRDHPAHEEGRRQTAASPKPKPAPKPRKWPMEKALANIETYAADLREWVRKLRGRLH